MLDRGPSIVCRFVAHGVCVGCGAMDARVHDALSTCFSCTGKIVAGEDKKRKIDGTMREHFLNIGAEIRKKVTEFNRA